MDKRSVSFAPRDLAPSPAQWISLVKYVFEAQQLTSGSQPTGLANLATNADWFDDLAKIPGYFYLTVPRQQNLH